MGAVDGRCALVTGGASGIGLAAARRLRAEGARVAVVDLNEEGGRRAARELDGVFVRADVSRPEEVARAFAEAEAALGRVDIAHLNAGVVTGEGDIARLTDDQYRRILGVNVDHVVFGTREAVRAMERAGGGAIVATASLAGLVAYAQDPVYALTKHAVVGFVRGLGEPLAARGITINAVCPGIVETPLLGEAAALLREAGFPLIQPEEVAGAVLAAITSGRSGECWVVQPGREPVPYQFRGVPGPRVPGKEGMRPPGFR